MSSIPTLAEEAVTFAREQRKLLRSSRLDELERMLHLRCNVLVNTRRLDGERDLGERIRAVRSVLDEIERRTR